MLRLASALARLISKDPNSPVASSPTSPIQKKRSLKSKPNWRSASIHNDGRSQGLKCPFTATNALTEATKKEIEAYNSSEELHAKSPEKEQRALDAGAPCMEMVLYKRRSLGLKPSQAEDVSPETKSPDSAQNDTADEEDAAALPRLIKKNSFTNVLPGRKTSCSGGIDTYRRRGSGAPMRPRLDSITLLGDSKNIDALKEKFGTPEKVMHFFGRCFVKFFSNYG